MDEQGALDDLRAAGSATTLRLGSICNHPLFKELDNEKNELFFLMNLNLTENNDLPVETRCNTKADLIRNKNAIGFLNSFYRPFYLFFLVA